MPRVPDASMVTKFARINATTIADPEKKSRTFVAVQKDGLQPSVLRASDVGSTVTPTRTVLAIPEWKSPQFNGRIFVK